MKINPDKEYDFVIVGSGFGGMCCAYILANEGYSVGVVEKNIQLGGNLQIFSRDKVILDTGVHYIGGLDKGENLYRFFQYFGLTETLKMQRLDDECFDLIQFSDGKSYKYGQGYPNFIKNLVSAFPEEEKAIRIFCDKVKEICKLFPLYNLEEESPNAYFDIDFRSINAQAYIASITDNVRLQNVLAGSNILYAGVKDKTPLYVHALILNSYICGSYRLTDGGAQLIKQFSKRIKARGGEFFIHKEIIGANYAEDGSVISLRTDTGETIRGKKFISNLHPKTTINIFGEERFIKVYRRRVQNLENTVSCFTLHLTFKPETFKYLNYNVYDFQNEDVWGTANYSQDNWPLGVFVSTPSTSKKSEYAESVSVMTYMHMDEFEKWKNTHNTTAKPGYRGDDYEAFKREKEEQMLKYMERVFPGIGEKIKNVYSSTPLTIRDYIGNLDGSLYGILKDSNDPLKTFINTRTKIPNLFLTGQNLIFHGIVGVTIGAFVTCFEFIERKKLLDEVKSFSE